MCKLCVKSVNNTKKQFAISYQTSWTLTTISVVSDDY